MALGICQDCRKQMSDSAKACPHCGSTRRPVTFVVTKKRKKITCQRCEGEKIQFYIIFNWRCRENREPCSGGCSRKEIQRRKRMLLDPLYYHDERDVSFNNVSIVSLNQEVCGLCNGSGWIEVEEEEKREIVM